MGGPLSVTFSIYMIKIQNVLIPSKHWTFVDGIYSKWKLVDNKFVSLVKES